MKQENKKIAVVLIRGMQGTTQEVKDTLRMLNLQRRNVCVVVDATPSMIGMINKVKSYVTYGEIDDETLQLLKKKKGESKFYNLNSPRKGYGRKGIKKYFVEGGALGTRGAAINDLIKRMI
jgi:large subunit ribosomal protein L30